MNAYTELQIAVGLFAERCAAARDVQRAHAERIEAEVFVDDSGRTMAWGFAGNKPFGVNLPMIEPDDLNLSLRSLLQEMLSAAANSQVGGFRPVRSVPSVPVQLRAAA